MGRKGVAPAGAQMGFGMFSLDDMPEAVSAGAEAVSGISGEKRTRRRTEACVTFSKSYELRRAASEVALLEALRYRPLEQGRAYHFLTMGDADSISLLKLVLNTHRLDSLIISTWVAAAEDILQLTEWYEQGRIGRMDMYFGEIFPGSYKIEWGMVREFYARHPEAGRAAVFRNHCKVIAGADEAAGFYFGIEGSANMNTNPRTEQGCITVDRGLYDFYVRFFDKIRSFEKEEEEEEQQQQ